MGIPSLRKKKVWEVISNSKVPIQGILHRKRDGTHVPLAFGKETNAMRIHDEGLALDLARKYDRRHGGDGSIVMVPVDDVDKDRPGQRAYRQMFTVPRLPWKKDEE